MMLRAWAILILLAPAWCQDHWVYLSSDGFQVFTNAGAKAGRAELVRLEQFRYSLGRIVGKPDLAISPPAQVILFKTSKEAMPYGDTFLLGRERVFLIKSADAEPADFRARLAKLLLDSGTDRMSGELERGLVSLFSTLEVSGIRITLGKPATQRDKDWARMHWLAVTPENYGRLPVLFYNLQKGADEAPAFRNAFGKSRAEIEAEVDRYFAAGNFPTSNPPSRPMSAEHDFPDKPVSPEDMQQKLASIAQERATLAEYDKLIGAGDSASLTRAIEISPKQAEPRFLLAQREPDVKKRIELLKAAIALDRRNASYWKALAESHAALHDYTESAKAWRSAEQASTTPSEREQMQRARLDVERQRLDYQDAEKKRIADENARDLQKLKDAEIAKLRALEARANQGASPSTPGEKVVPWWNGPTPDAKAAGLLQQVDCLGKQARLVIKAEDGKIVRLVVRDPGQIVIVGATQENLGCGRQKPRPITVEYFRKADPKLATTGEVATIEFR